MYICVILIWIGTCLLPCSGREPYKPRDASITFAVHFPSRYRGTCVGTLISRTAVLTAAVCVTNPLVGQQDTRPINVVVGTHYRHPRRGIRVQVTMILVPNLNKMDQENRGYLMSKHCAVLILKRKVPDVLVEQPLRALDIDYISNDLRLQQECLMPGWHFFYKGDKIYDGNKFLLQRNLRVQKLNIVKKSLWCETLIIKFQKALSNMGFFGTYDKSAFVCIGDGMYGAPLICDGKAVGMMMAPDAQWSNCTGYSNLIHLFNGDYLRNFMDCISSLFHVESPVPWNIMKKDLLDKSSEEYDPLEDLYDKLLPEIDEDPE